MYKTLIALAFLCAPLMAGADEGQEPIEDLCSEGRMPQMTACMIAEQDKVEDRLNAYYKDLLSVLEDPTKLRAAQSAWLHFRDLSCKYVNSGISEAGDMYQYSLSACHLNLTKKRIRDFQRYLDSDCNGCPPRK